MSLEAYTLFVLVSMFPINENILIKEEKLKSETNLRLVEMGNSPSKALVIKRFILFLMNTGLTLIFK